MKSLFIVFLLPIFVVFTYLSLDRLVPFLQPKTGQLSVKVKGQKAKVFLDNKLLGNTPYYGKNLQLGEKTVKIEGEEGKEWETKVTLTNSTLSVLNLDLAPNNKFIAGENLFFKKGTGGTAILTRPEKAKLVIDEQEKGESPLNIDLNPGVHVLNVKKDGYLEREVVINIEPNFKLSSVIYLSADPFLEVSKLDANSKLSLFQISNSKLGLERNIEEWVEGINYVQNNFEGVQTKFDLLIDETGKTYPLNTKSWQDKVTKKSVANIGYLTKKDTPILKVPAANEWNKLKTLFQ